MLCRATPYEGVPAREPLTSHASEAIAASFVRIQCTPDLLPADAQHDDLRPRTANSRTEGPRLANIVLADEINRAPAKVQSARWKRCRGQVSIGGTTFRSKIPSCAATQNPIDTSKYAPPEASSTASGSTSHPYPTRDEEKQILDRFSCRRRAEIARAPPRRSSRLRRARRRALDSRLANTSPVVYATASRRLPSPSLSRSTTRTPPPALLAQQRVPTLRQGRGHVEPDGRQGGGMAVLRHRSSRSRGRSGNVARRDLRACWTVELHERRNLPLVADGTYATPTPRALKAPRIRRQRLHPRTRPRNVTASAPILQGDLVYAFSSSTRPRQVRDPSDDHERTFRTLRSGNATQSPRSSAMRSRRRGFLRPPTLNFLDGGRPLRTGSPVDAGSRWDGK